MVKILSNVRPLLQSDYGEDNDCSITSITTCVYYHSYGIDNDFEEIENLCRYIYNNLATLAENNYFYNGKTYGTIPFFIKGIYNWGLLVFNNSLKRYCKTKSAYLKGIGFNYQKICDIIDDGKPIILSVNKCGKYKNHSVTVVGYMTTSKQLIVYDNWTKAQQCIKYDDISLISCINYQARSAYMGVIYPDNCHFRLAQYLSGEEAQS